MEILNGCSRSHCHCSQTIVELGDGLSPCACIADAPCLSRLICPSWLMARDPQSRVVQALGPHEQQDAVGWRVRRPTGPIFHPGYPLLLASNASSGRALEGCSQEKASRVSPSGHNMEASQNCHQVVLPALKSQCWLAVPSGPAQCVAEPVQHAALRDYAANCSEC